jgi:hypothetical protein
MKKGKITLFLFIVSILIIAVTSWLLLDSGRVVSKAVEKLSQAKTQNFSSTITILNTKITEGMLGEQASIEIEISGFFERQPKGWDSLSADVKIATKADSVTMQIEGKAIFIDDKAYIKIIKAPAAFPELVQLKDVWLALPRGGDNTLSQLNSDEINFTNIKRAGKKNIGGQKLTSYQAEADQTAMLHMLDGVAGILGTRLSTEQIVGFREQVKNAGSSNVEMSIAPWTNDLRYFATAISAPNGNQIDIAVTLGKRNQIVDIVAPADAVSLQDIASAVNEQNTNSPLGQ